MKQEQGKKQTLAKNRAKRKTLVFLRLGKGLNDRTDVTADLTARRGSEEWRPRGGGGLDGIKFGETCVAQWWVMAEERGYRRSKMKSLTLILDFPINTSNFPKPRTCSPPWPLLRGFIWREEVPHKIIRFDQAETLVRSYRCWSRWSNRQGANYYP